MSKKSKEDLHPDEDYKACDWCGKEERYPLVSWHFVLDESGGSFCSKECYEKWREASKKLEEVAREFDEK